MKHCLLFILLVASFTVKAQQIDSIYVNLYTDSLKKGTYNYINIDGLLSNGRYIPLDSTDLIFATSSGSFSGNSLWIDPTYTGKKVTVKVLLRKNPAICKEFDVYLKTLADNEILKTADEILQEMRENRTSKKKGG